MQDCTKKSFCDAVRSKLLELGVKEPEIEMGCAGPWPCYATFENVKLLLKYANPDNAKEITKFVGSFFGGKLPIHNTPFMLQSVKKDDPFRCNVLGIDVYQPCSVTTCAFHTDAVWFKNCMIHYATEHKRKDGLDVKELSMLMGEPSLSIRGQIKKVMTRMRKIAVMLEAEQQDDQVVEFSDDSCSACGNKLESVYRTKYGFTYCSEECYTTRPPVDLQIEREFSRPVQSVLAICINSFASKKAIMNTLGVNPKQFDELVSRHNLEIDHLD